MVKNDYFNPFVDDLTALIGMKDADFLRLRENKAFFLKYAEPLLDHIIAVLIEHDSTRAVFEQKRGNADCLRASLANWLVDLLTTGEDTQEFWRKQYIIGYQHIKRDIPNRHMMGLGSRIKELVLPIMLKELGVEEGCALFLSFQRFLDMVIGLTCCLVEEGKRKCLRDATGFTPTLLEFLEDGALKKMKDEFL